MLSSQKCYLKYGVYRSLLTHLTTRTFHFPLDYMDCLKSCFILKQQNSFILSHITDKKGVYMKDDISYTPIFLTPRGTLLSRPDSYSYLSFREAQEDFAIPPVVLISSTLGV